MAGAKTVPFHADHLKPSNPLLLELRCVSQEFDGKNSSMPQDEFLGQQDVASTDALDSGGNVPKEFVVRQYGLLDPLDWGEDCEEQLRLQTQFWNALIEIERGHRDAYLAATADNPAVAALEARVREEVDVRAALVAERRARRKAARGRVPSKDLNDRITRTSQEIASLCAGLRQARRDARERVMDKMSEIHERRRAAVKRARQQFAQSGLWWGNYNAVAQSHEVGRKLAIKRGGQLRIRRHDGSGRFTNQIRKGSDPVLTGMSVDDLFSGAMSQVSVGPLPDNAFTHPSRSERSRLQRTKLTATVFMRHGERRSVTWPMLMHRPIPDDCRIKIVTVKRRRLGDRWHWKATFVCTRACQLTLPEGGRVVAVDLGWRKLPDGIRVATVLRNDEATPSFVVLDQATIDAFAHVDELRSRRDKMRDEITPLVRSLDWSGAPAAIAALGEGIKCSTVLGPNRLARLAIVWRDFPTYQHKAFEQLETWRRFEKKLWLEEVNLREKLRGRRRDYYRRAAKVIVAGARKVVIDRAGMAQAARVNHEDGRDPVLHAAARHNRTLAAPGELAKWINVQAAKVGAEVVEHGGVSTWICHCCGMEVAPSTPSALHQSCPHCHAYWDQDVNAARNLLRVGTADGRGNSNVPA
jgi:transposase